ncbi:molybdopterin-dependent oxidoreductase [Streptomyces sp. DG2A-72]|uniref:molybdopterin cofactor-binding domain-containing protein n=1 Tax=Streptomyces sp. DG2A-72 TaxID=3051386 RepID=UPI00265B7CA6|nr:molybdopterin cofactor-binding domain-containing protein [Streptomyces sp. DG2A-72]MDO0930525.1 molybdopterin-dependent oxidoreductase [Streptomyces sp. DG2A-72]
MAETTGGADKPPPKAALGRRTLLTYLVAAPTLTVATGLAPATAAAAAPRAVIAVDVGRPINPRGIEAQMVGGLTDAISTTLTAGLHIDKGLPLEGSYSQFHYARQRNSPTDVQVIVMPAHGEPGGAGELGVPAAVGAIANAYARATGTRPRSFPVDFPVDFEPFPR